MRLLILLAILLLPLSAFAQSTLPLGFDNSVTVLHPSPGISQLYDQRGNGLTIYESGPNLSWYSQHDRYGKIQSQGYVFDPLGPPQPLRVPDSMRYVPQPSK
jgi:hypothetical protein